MIGFCIKSWQSPSSQGHNRSPMGGEHQAPNARGPESRAPSKSANNQPEPMARNRGALMGYARSSSMAANASGMSIMMLWPQGIVLRFQPGRLSTFLAKYRNGLGSQLSARI